MASSAKRRKELARARWERQQRRRAEREMRRKRLSVITGVIVSAAVVIGGGVLVTNALSGDDAPGAAPSTEPSADPSTEASADPTAAAPVDPADCVYRDTGDPAVEGIGLPTEFTADDTLPKSTTLTINGKDVTIDLLPDAAPCTVRSFDFLAGKDYFDGTKCHRLTTGGSLKVLQCGDPKGDGTGGPGYEFDNENTDGATYSAGTVAMANSGPDTNGSQFFLVYEDSQLPPDYTVFGQISGGLDVITDIAAEGVAGGGTDGAPAKTVTLEEVATS